MTEPLLAIEGLGVRYQLRDADLHAVTGVSLTLGEAESLGVVGESGCGKTTLAQAVMRLLPDNGRLADGSAVRLAGRELTTMPDDQFRRDVRWKQISMVFQSAMNSLNPVAGVGAQLGRITRLHEPDLARADVRERTVELLRMVGLPASVADRYPHELSGGMRQRVVIAASLVASPRVVIADEATTALDVVVQAQILAELAELRQERGLAMIVVSHDVDVVRAVCDQVAVMYAGEVVETGPAAEVLSAPAHPYTAALLASLPRLDGPRRRLATLSGGPPDLAPPPSGCRFAARCPIAAPVCATAPPLLPTRPGHEARCHFPSDPRLTSALAEEAR